MHRFTRRHLLVLLSSTAAAGLLASCAGGQATPTSAPAGGQATPTRAPAASPTAAAQASPTAPSATPTVAATPTRSGPVTLKILQWSHFVPDYDKWFDQWVQEWGAKNNVQVVSDHINYADIPARAAAEVSAQSGHDLFAFGFPPSQYETEVVPLNDLIKELKQEYGDYYPLLEHSCYNPKTDVWYSFMDFWAADPILYRKDLFDQVGKTPDTWQDILEAGRQLKQMRNPIGIGFSPEIDTGMAMRTIMWGFGTSIQDANGNVVINKPETLEALEFAKQLLQEAETEEVLAWDAASNNRFLVSGRGALILNAISATRTAEATYPDLAPKIAIAKTAAGPRDRKGSAHWYNCFVIWKFSPNVDVAKQFLKDLVAAYQDAFKASKFYNIPSFPKAVPDWQQQVQNDPNANPPDKYAMLATAPDWTVNVGWPGYMNAAEAEIFDRWIINDLFTKVATGKASPQDALAEAERQIQDIFKKWKDRGLV